MISTFAFGFRCGDGRGAGVLLTGDKTSKQKNDTFYHFYVNVSVTLKMNLYSAISRKASIVLDALVSGERDRLQCAPKDTVAHSRFTQFDMHAVYSRRSDLRQRRPADRVCYVDTAERSLLSAHIRGFVDYVPYKPTFYLLTYLYLLMYLLSSPSGISA